VDGKPGSLGVRTVLQLVEDFETRVRSAMDRLSFIPRRPCDANIGALATGVSACAEDLRRLYGAFMALMYL
jgi:hypothetical protein